MLGKVKESDFVVKELVTDKCSTTNAIFCKHYPGGASDLLLEPLH